MIAYPRPLSNPQGKFRTGILYEVTLKADSAHLTVIILNSHQTLPGKQIFI